MNVKNWWNDAGGGKLRYLEKNLLHCHFDQNKSRIDYPGTEVTGKFLRPYIFKVVSVYYQIFQYMNMFNSWNGEEASLLKTMQTGFRVYLASYLVVSGDSLIRDKVA